MTHHIAKEQLGVRRSAIQRISGSLQIGAKLDGQFYLSHNKAGEMLVEHGKARGCRKHPTFVVRKEDFLSDGRPIDLGRPDELPSMTRLVYVDSAHGTDTTEDDRLERGMRGISKAKGPMEATKFDSWAAKALSVSPRAIRACRARMQASGALIVIPDGRRRLVSLPTDGDEGPPQESGMDIGTLAPANVARVPG
jgi:hypothetical protein